MARVRFDFSPIGFGAFKIGRNAGIKYPQAYDLPTLDQVDRLLNGVLDLGINYVDTAPAYGFSEERIGRAIAHRRGEFILATKVGEFFEEGVSWYDFSHAAMEESVGNSLKRLRTDVLDLLFLHSSRDDVRVLQETDAVETLMRLREKGLVRGIGVSGYTAEAFRRSFDWADAIMVAYHPDDAAMAPVMDEAAKRGISVIVKKALGSGRVPPRDAIPFALGNPAVACVVVGSLRLDHMRENLRIAETVQGVESTTSRAAGSGSAVFRPVRGLDADHVKK